MNRVQQMTEELNRVLHSTTYQFEIDTEDYVFGFKETIRTRTKDLAMAIKLEQKVRKDLGRFLSETVRVVAVRMYKNGELKAELKAEETIETDND